MAFMAHSVRSNCNVEMMCTRANEARMTWMGEATDSTRYSTHINAQDEGRRCESRRSLQAWDIATQPARLRLLTCIAVQWPQAAHSRSHTQQAHHCSPHHSLHHSMKRTACPEASRHSPPLNLLPLQVQAPPFRTHTIAPPAQHLFPASVCDTDELHTDSRTCTKIRTASSGV
jgi:hypothetical protein